MNWQKSSFSEDQANCVELASSPTGIHIRESDAPHTVITTDRTRLAAVLRALKADATVTRTDRP